MNSLNSILIEGKLLFDPVVTKSGGMKSCSFQISSDRYFRENEKSVKRSINLEIEAHGKMAENCLINLKANNGCRVVGRLDTKLVSLRSEESGEEIESEKVIIVAEHVEFKPVKKSNGN